MIAAYRRWQRNASSILGINRRNLDFIYRLNRRSRFPLVDDKVRAKNILSIHGIAIPEALAVVDTRAGIAAAIPALERHEDFVVKPACGFGGGGIEVFGGPTCETGEGSDRTARLRFHMTSILAGMYSLDAEHDRVLVEELVVENPGLRAIHGDAGVCDIRLILSDGRVVMAMLRVPCQASRPTANLHRGGIGVGIDMETGLTTFAVCRGRPILSHPDTGVALSGIAVPFWDEALEMARPLNEMFGLGYLGVDVVVHATRGPLVLEINARPGLAIQLANMRGLRTALSGGVPSRGGSRC